MAESEFADYADDYEDELGGEEVLDWLEGELGAFEQKLGRALTIPEIEALTPGVIQQAESTGQANVQVAFDQIYPAGDAPDINTDEGRLHLLAEHIEDEREQQQEMEDMTDEGED